MLDDVVEEVRTVFEQKVYQAIYDAGYTDIINPFSDVLLPTDSILKRVEVIQAAYNEEEFWHDLMVQFGKRDFFRSVTEKGRAALEQDGWLPERVHEYYEKYDAEFSEHGIERFEIQQS